MSLKTTNRFIKRSLSGPYWALRGLLSDISTYLRRLFGDTMKAAAMLLVLRPAADWLPQRSAHALARLCGKVSTGMSASGRRKQRLIRRTIVDSTQEARKLAVAVMSRHFLDFVFFRRYLRGREDFDDWSVIEVNSDIMDRLRHGEGSYIVATGHFARNTALPVYSRRVVPQRAVAVVNPPIPKSIRPSKIWLRAHYHQMLDGLKRIRPEMRLLYPKSPDLIKVLLRTLKEPGNALIIAVDAPWHKGSAGSVSRPFAGRTNATFAVGTARLSRLAQCPIAVCVTYVNGLGQTVFHWVRIIDPPDREDADADAVITNLMLNDVECAIGLRPDQYVMDFLGERRWDSKEQRWHAMPASAPET